MTHEGSARSRRLLLAFILLIAIAIAPLGRAADAGLAPGPERMRPVTHEGAPDPGGEPDRWWGVAGAALCGLEIRLVIRVPAVGMNPYAIAAGIAGCSLAALDVLTTH